VLFLPEQTNSQIKPSQKGDKWQDENQYNIPYVRYERRVKCIAAE
jgi:hypothetical protein